MSSYSRIWQPLPATGRLMVTRLLVWSDQATRGPKFNLHALNRPLLPHAESQVRLVVSSPEHNLYNARFSPDERWIAFNAIRSGRPGSFHGVRRIAQPGANGNA